MHLFGGAHAKSFDASRRVERSGAADQNHAGAAARGGIGQRVAHAAGGAIGQIANRVEIFASGPGGDEHGLAREIVADAQAHRAPLRRWLRRRPGGLRPIMPQAR